MELEEKLNNKKNNNSSKKQYAHNNFDFNDQMKEKLNNALS